jgi:hypothetical protein
LLELTSDSEDTTNQEYDNKHSNLTKSQRPSNLNTTEVTHLRFQTKEETINSEYHLPTQDGGNSSDIKEDSFKTKEERSWMFMVAEIRRTEIS